MDYLSTNPVALLLIFLLVILKSCWILFWPFGVFDWFCKAVDWFWFCSWVMGPLLAGGKVTLTELFLCGCSVINC